MSATPRPTPPRPKSDRRGGGFKALAASVGRFTKPIFGKRGLADGAIAAEWPLIIGETLAGVTMPEKISYPRGDRRGGTLYLRVANGSFATELIHLEPQLIERINRYFGYQAIARVKLNQGPLHAPAARALSGAPKAAQLPQKPGVSATPSDDRLAGVDDPELYAALRALGEAVNERQDKYQGKRHKTDIKP
ncbi:MAG: DUF721 domain-containing protein [Rhodospirillales bacterium]